MSATSGEKRIRDLTLEEAFSPRKRARTVASPSVDWLRLFPELLDLLARQCWADSRDGLSDLEEACGTPRNISKSKMKKGLSKLRIAAQSLNAFALVCRTWWAAVPWAEIWRTVHLLYHRLAPIKCNRFTMGPYAGPDYHVMLCGILAAPGSRRHFLRTRRALEPEIRMAMEKFQSGAGGGGTWWVSYHHSPSGRRCGYNEEIFRPDLGFVPTLLEQITSYWDYELRKWMKPGAKTTVAKIRQQEQWCRQSEAAFRAFRRIVDASKTSPPITIPPTIDEQLVMLDKCTAAVSDRIKAGATVRRISDYAILQAQLSDVLEAMMQFETALRVDSKY